MTTPKSPSRATPKNKKAADKKDSSKKAANKKASSKKASGAHPKELVIVTGISGAGKASALKAFEDLEFHCVDNLPLELLPEFAAILDKSTEVERADIVMDVRA